MSPRPLLSDAGCLMSGVTGPTGRVPGIPLWADQCFVRTRAPLRPIFKGAGYQTGMFGKWHLGDVSYRPEDRGFDEVYRHGGGGVGQTPDVWDNSYFDGGYFHNGRNCTRQGVFARIFLVGQTNSSQVASSAELPFHNHISTNAPHGPLHCPPKNTLICTRIKHPVRQHFWE